MVQNKAFMYKAVPQGWPVPDKDLAIESTDFDLEAPPPKNGFTTKNIYAAFDPSQRGRMRDPSIGSYSPAMEAGKPVQSVTTAGKVLKSDNPAFKEGDTVLVTYGYTETYSAVTEQGAKASRVIKPAPGVPLTAYLGALGMTGMTAYGSLHEIGQPKKGEVIWVSGAAGAVGQVVGQIAVREGLKVIGSVGDDKKLEFITKELGFTAGFNYKKESPADALKRLAPDGIDIFFDNVGGEQLDTALVHLNTFGRISEYALELRDICTDSSQLRAEPSPNTTTKRVNHMVSRILPT